MRFRTDESKRTKVKKLLAAQLLVGSISSHQGLPFLCLFTPLSAEFCYS